MNVKIEVVTIKLKKRVKHFTRICCEAAINCLFTAILQVERLANEKQMIEKLSAEYL